MKQRKILLFDLGGVLVESTGRKALRALLPNLGSEQDVLDRWHESAAVGRFERGKITPNEFARSFIDDWDLKVDEGAFLQSFGSWVRGFYPGAEALVERLRSEHRLACLSNTNSIHWAQLPGVQLLFDFRFASHITGFMKPDRQAYANALETMGVSADDVYFFDDLAVNIQAARDIGMHAFHVNGLRETEAALRTAGLLQSD